MGLPFTLCLAATILSPAAFASNACPQPDKNFGSFLSKFKSDVRFRESRLILPLQQSYSDPDGKSTSFSSLKDLRTGAIILNEVHDGEMANTDGRVCESRPSIKGNRASFAQHSCDTDAYSHTYYFIRKNGCWMLEKKASSHG